MKSIRVSLLSLWVGSIYASVLQEQKRSDAGAVLRNSLKKMRGTSFGEHVQSRVLHQTNNKQHHHSKNNNNNKDTDTAFPVDISSYSLRFEKCQGVKTGKEQQTVQRFAVFRLCPHHECSSCNDNYGEYTLPLEEYLEILSNYFHETKGALCETCQHCLDPAEKDRAESKLEDFNSNCVKCDTECTMLGNLESNGYIDATDFLKCTLIHEGPNGEKRYAGPVCSKGGDAIAIGVFMDEYCAVEDTSKHILDVVNDESGQSVKLAYSFMRLTYTETCLSCAEDGVEGAHDLMADHRDADTVKAFCEDIYGKAAKCENPHGFAVARNPPLGQTAGNEKEVCDFISQVQTKHSGPEQFVGDESISAEAFAEEEVLDVQSMIMIIAGGVLLLLYVMFKCLCNSNASSYRTASFSEKIDSYGGDHQVIKVSKSCEDAEETEEESSSSSMLCETALLDMASE